jgi:DNA topoisomerase-3
VVARDRAIAAFVPGKYWEVKGTFTTPAGERFDALWGHLGGDGRGPAARKVSRLGAAALADDLVQRLLPPSAAGAAGDLAPVVESIRARRTREPPPLLFDLTSLQRTANRRFGLSAARTLEIAQALYETHKILTYPRTDARHLSRDLAATLPKLFASLEAVPDYQPHARQLLDLGSDFASNRRIFDDAKVQDHHAIIPTGKRIDLAALSRDERRLFDLVARRFLAAFFPDAEFAATDVVIRVGKPAGPVGSSPPADATRAGAGDDIRTGADAKPGAEPKDEPVLDRLPPPPDRFYARGRVRLSAGWQDVAGIGPGDAGKDAGAGAAPDEAVLPVLTEGARLQGQYASAAKETRPPPHLTEATLLAAMETAGRTIEDDELRAAMKDSGLGTPATRAATIETLIKRGFMGRAGKNLVATPTGIALIGALPVASLGSPELTGRWEARLSRIARGLEGRAAFMADIARYVEEVVVAVRAAPVNAVMAGSGSAPGAGRERFASRSQDDRPAAGAPFAAPTRASGDARASGKARASGNAGASEDGSAHGRDPQPSRDKTGRAGKPAATKRARPSSSRGSSGAANSRGSAGADSRPSAGAADSCGGNAPPARATIGSPAPAGSPASLTCPRCRQGELVTGKRGWGCSRWRQGCGFVVWFDLDGRRLSDAQLRDLVGKGKTRKTSWPRGGAVVSGHLVLDLAAPAGQGAARFEPG